jgi:hypothetical protein
MPVNSAPLGAPLVDIKLPESLDWSEFNRRKGHAVGSMLVLPIGMLITVVSIGTKFFWLIPVGVALIFFSMWVVNRFQQTPCPKCGELFLFQWNPLVSSGGIFKLFDSNKCQSCGVERE